MITVTPAAKRRRDAGARCELRIDVYPLIEADSWGYSVGDKDRRVTYARSTVEFERTEAQLVQELASLFGVVLLRNGLSSVARADEHVRIAVHYRHSPVEVGWLS